jgi:hypothetical protein
MSSELIPAKLVVEILCRLPPKSLMRFRCVCKSWNSVINDPSFISLHYLHSPSFLLLRLFREHATKPFYCSLRLDDILKFTLFNRSPSPFPRDSSIDAVCNGLICLGSQFPDDFWSSYFVIYNPSLRRYLPLPKPKPIPEP